MRAKSPEKRSRQKVISPLRIDNERNTAAAPQYFQVTVNVLEARKLAWSNLQSVNSYVVCGLGKKKHRTAIRRNTREPSFREHFVFELHCNLWEMERSSLWLAVMEPKCCSAPRPIGETNIDLGAVWAQPLHQIFHKWAQLSLPSDPNAGGTGFLKLDVSVTYRTDVQTMSANMNSDRIEDNLLLLSECEQQTANYLVTIYNVFGLPSGGTSQGDGRYGKPPSTFVRVSFCGLVAKTAIQHKNAYPSFCEQISFVEMFPSKCDLIRLEVCSGDGYFNKILGCTQVSLGQISHDGQNGYLPTFGPSLVHIYATSALGSSSASDADGPYHRGAMLVSMKTIVPYHQEGLRTVTVEPVASISMDKLWTVENFCLLCPILEVSMIDRRIAGKFCGIAITMGDIFDKHNGDEEFLNLMNEIRTRKLHYTGSLEVHRNKPTYGYLNLSNPSPVLQMATYLPDFRFRMYRNNMINGIVTRLVLSTSDVERRFYNQEYTSPHELIDNLNKAIDDASGNILKVLDILKYCCASGGDDNMMKSCSTELEERQLKLQKEMIEKIYLDITKKKFSCFKITESENNNIVIGSTSKKYVKIMIAKSKALAESLRQLIFKSPEGWPDIVLWLLSGGSRIAFSKITPADVIYSVIPEQSGRLCNKIQTIYMRPLKCPKHMNITGTTCCCVAGKVELLVWMGLYRQVDAFESHLPQGYELAVKDYDIYLKSSTALMLECRIFVYRAKLNININTSSAENLFVRVNTMNSVEESLATPKTTAPVWNQMLKVCKVVNTSPERIINYPPYILVEIYDSDLSGKTELIGCLQLQPIVGETNNFEYSPKLDWYDLYKGNEHTGQLLISAQLLQIPETLMKTTMYSTEEEMYYVSATNETNLTSDCVQPIPSHFLPKSNIYKLDIYWWGLRDLNITRKPCVVLELDNLTLKSDIINEKSMNCNFPNGRISQIFEAALYENHCPPMTIRLCDSNTFGRTVFFGTKVIKNPTKYVIDCLPKSVRDVTLKTSSIISADFFQVTQMLYVLKSQSSSKNSSDSMSLKLEKSYQMKQQSKFSNFFRKALDEEKHSLLPLMNKGGNRDLSGRIEQDFRDWWYRFNASKKNSGDGWSNSDKIVIYNSELESQPEFSKFKDWCSKFKLYNENNTALTVNDETSHCCSLKAGIAIYEWPPSEETVAVSLNGVDLNSGYFSNYPPNEMQKFLIRTYVVRCFNLVTKDFTGKCDPFVIISCGNKHLGDRSEYIPNTNNPVFGKVYEFRCILPEDYKLTVSLHDYSSEDDLIGFTNIDIENRIYTRHRARIGLPTKYKMTGCDKWRDTLKPSQILEELCVKNDIPLPQYPDIYTVVLNGVEYKSNERSTFPATAMERRENICLNLIHNWHTMPVCGYRLVPEHVETRSLFNPDRPGQIQGKIQMWMDIYPMDVYTLIPPPVDITPPKHQNYELRVVIWDALHLKINKDCANVDLYVKAWLGSAEDAQFTDVHYRAATTKGSFNWRMIFQFQYKHKDRKLVHKEKTPFTEVEEQMEPIIIFQVLDSEGALDDVSASLALNLNSMPRGFEKASQCRLEDMQNLQKINLFSLRSLRAWWPLKITNPITCYSRNAGCIELELMLLPLEKAVLMPVGLGREPPAPLPLPDRRLPTQSSVKRALVNFYKHGGLEILIGLVFMASIVIALIYWKIPTLVYEFFFVE